MLIRWAQIEDIPAWKILAEEVADLFDSPDMPNDPGFSQFMLNKIAQYEALVAIDRMSSQSLGFIGFSRTHNRISWLAVSDASRQQGAGSALLRCAILQMDSANDITVCTFASHDPKGKPARELYNRFGFIETDHAHLDEQGYLRSLMTLPAPDRFRGGSFHYQYDRYARLADPTGCPVCKSEVAAEPPVLIKELPYSWLECYPDAQGALFGKCHVLSKVHAEHLHDLDADAMQHLMLEVQQAGQALLRVTGAVKINYEIHGNSMPHLHIHLFPRYLDDAFPSAPIDYRITSPSPYKNPAEFAWFVDQMRHALSK